jgi:hypothetical protein
MSAFEASKAWYCFFDTQEDRAIAKAIKLHPNFIMGEDSSPRFERGEPLFTCVAEWTYKQILQTEIQFVIE